MAVKIKEIIDYMEEIAPASLAEDWDNVGLLLGGGGKDIGRVMVCLDVGSSAIDQAIKNGVDLIISHHPLIFKQMKKITDGSYKGREINKLIRNNISVFSAHTNLDTAPGGTNDMLAEVLQLKDVVNLKSYKHEKLFKVVVYVPEEHAEPVRDVMSRAGAGWIGKYSDCFFITSGTGTFKPMENTKPYIGEKGKLEKVNESRLETITTQKLLPAVLNAMLEKHPYEEPAYDVYQLYLDGLEYGLGKVGCLDNPMDIDSFIQFIKGKLSINNVRVIGCNNKIIKKVAVFCGSFDGSWNEVVKSNADVLVTGDIKYHDAMDASEMGICVIDAGHFATERVLVPRLVERLKKRFDSIDIFGCSVEEDPFKTY